MPPVPPPPGFEEIQRQELSRLYGHVVGVRLVFVPAVMGIAIAAAFTEPAAWRRVLAVGTASVFVTFFAVEWVRFRRHGAERLNVPLNLAAAALGQALVSLATGGLSSPFVVVAVPLAVVFGLNLAPAAAMAIVAFQLAVLAAFAALALGGAIPDLNLALLGGGSHVGNASWAWSQAAVLALLVVAGAGIGRTLRVVFDGMVRKALTAQQESLRSHRERAEELSALSAEIAHELKNPLASVKGLAGLLAQDVPPGKPAERLAVLRREVDRMQGILDEFLNFSRPLVPLALGRVDLGALAAEVAALHEGIAQDRGVAVSVRGEASGRCDPRKVKQVLINLVQNAIDASPAGAAVEIEVGEDVGGTRLCVLDRGRGVDPALGRRVFDAGVTTKARGSGLGLTVARALARQHGGDLGLAPRPGGGCAAELRLPADPAAAPAGSEGDPPRAAAGASSGAVP